MTQKRDEEIVYSISVGDIQDVAIHVLERFLSRKEVVLVKESIGEYVDWFGAIEGAIQKHVQK